MKDTPKPRQRRPKQPRVQPEAIEKVIKTQHFSTIRPSKEKTGRDALCDGRPSKCMIPF